MIHLSKIFLKCQRKCLLYWGSDILNNQKIFFKFLIWFNLIYYTFSMIPYFHYIFNNMQNIDEVTQAFGPLLSKILIIVRIFVLIIRREKISNIIKKLKDLWINCKKNYFYKFIIFLK